MTNPHPRILIIGAGACGLTLAHTLEAFGIQDFEILDKARGPGGRMASRRLKNADGTQTSFDTGVQQIESHEASLRALWQEAEKAGVLEPAKTEETLTWLPKPGMSALAKLWAGNLSAAPDGKSKLQLDTRVKEISHSHEEARGAPWELSFEKHSPKNASLVVLSCPLPQALALLPKSIPAPKALERVEVDPAACLLWTEKNGSVGRRNWNAPEDFRFLEALLELDASTALPRAEAQAREEGHLPAQDSLAETYLHRWRYSRVRGALEAPWLEAAPGLFLAGDAFAAAEGLTDVERSVLSGRLLGSTCVAPQASDPTFVSSRAPLGRARIEREPKSLVDLQKRPAQSEHPGIGKVWAARQRLS
jgi:predicted NAD/FAD-dependent oxidoreductase